MKLLIRMFYFSKMRTTTEQHLFSGLCMKDSKIKIMKTNLLKLGFLFILDNLTDFAVVLL